jgi:hypothetical protein
MALPEFDSLKQLSVSHECYHSDDYFPEQFIFFLPSFGYTVVTSILIFSIKSFGSVDWVCLAYDRISEHCAAISHYFLQKKSSLFWSFFCISDSVSCSAVNLYTAAIISFYAT